jgi:AcrR family transcriptional regulator
MVSGQSFLLHPQNTDRILKDVRLSQYSDREENKVLQAISEVVLEEGPQASLGKIAKKAGMTKSSLYFYFKNKEEMIIKTMNGQTERFIDFYYKNLSSYENIGEQLFAHFVITASMAIEMPKTIPMIHWFITRGMAENFKKPTDFENYRIFFENAVNYRYLNTHGVTADKLLMLVNFCVTYEINNIQRKNLSKEEKYRLVYGLYDLFTHGLKGLKRDKTGRHDVSGTRY